MRRNRAMRDNGRKRGTVAAAAVVGLSALVLAACGSSKSSSGTTAPSTTPTTVAGAKVTGGTVTWAEGAAATPNYIFPMAPFADFSVANLAQFSNMLYRPLYWFGSHDSPTVDFSKSVGQDPVWSDNDTVVSVTLNNYKWSDGEPMDARDVEFWMNMLKAEKTNWADYTPGFFPDNVTSVTATSPTSSTVTFHLNKSYNPTWFLYNELSQITPMPLAWDKTSAAGATPTATSTTAPDLTPAGAAKVYTYLTNAAKSLTTYTSSPIWTVVDGPWKLTNFTSQGEADFVPNPDYTGSDKPIISEFKEIPYTSDDAEFNTLKTGPSNLTVGYIPPQDYVQQKAAIESGGYSVTVSYPYAFNYLSINFENPTVGPLFSQLYIRQALQELVDQAGWIKAFYADLAAPTYGPVPVEPPNPFSDTFEKSDPYPFSVAAATALLTSHGWTVNKGGTSTCTKPGTGAGECGAGIKAGAPLAFNLDFASGAQSLTASMDDYKAVAAQAGVQLTEKQLPFDSVIGEAVPCKPTAANCKWEIANWGGGWVYSPDYYASGESLFSTGAGSNSGSYSDPTANKLIALTTTIGAAGSQTALDNYQDYIAKQLPVIYQPASASAAAFAKNLSGAVPNVFDNLDPESWYFTK